MTRALFSVIMGIAAQPFESVPGVLASMAIMAAACGVLIVVLGLLSVGPAPTEAQFGVEITCLVGGLILCFLAVILARLKALMNRLGIGPRHAGDGVRLDEA